MNKNLLEILVCPKCKGNLTLSEKEDQLTCIACARDYPIQNDMPIMVADY